MEKKIVYVINHKSFFHLISSIALQARIKGCKVKLFCGIDGSNQWKFIQIKF